MGPQPPAQAAGAQPAAASAAYPASVANASPQARYPASGAGSGNTDYASPAAGENATEYYPPARTTSPSSSTRTAEPALTAVLGNAPSGVSAQVPVRLLGNAALLVAAVLPPSMAAAAAPQGASGQPGPARPAAVSPGEAPSEALPSGFPGGNIVQAEWVSGSPFSEAEPVQVFPLALPLPGWLIAADLSAWERGVQELFRRLDALADEVGEEASMGRLAPWCAALGAMTLVLELTRRRLSKRHPADPGEVRGRGLAWSWSHDPQGREPWE
jgi:hypothetical protein